MKSLKLINMESGSDAGISSAIFLSDLIRHNPIKDYVVFCDLNDKVLEAWTHKYPGCLVINQKDLFKKENLHDYIFMPIDEYSRAKLENKDINMFGFKMNPKIKIKDIHNKSKCYDLLMKKGLGKYLPKRYRTYDDTYKIPVNKGHKIVIRENVSAGCKGLRIEKVDKYFDNDVNWDFRKTIVTEFIDFDDEYVCDFVNAKSNLIIYPRITKLLKHGADTDVVICNWHDKRYKLILDFICKIINALDYQGIGMVQFGMKGDNIYFIEMGCRISGSSYLNFDLFGFNPYDMWLNDRFVGLHPTEDIWYSTRLRRFL